MTKRRKAAIAFGIVIALMLSLTGCGEDDNQKKTSPVSNAEGNLDVNSDDVKQSDDKKGNGGAYKQFDETAFMLNGKEFKFPYYNLDKLCEEAGLHPRILELAELTMENAYTESTTVALYETENVEEEWDSPHVEVFVRNMEEKKSIPVGEGYITSISVDEEYQGIDFSIRGIKVGSTLEEMKEAFKDFENSENKEFKVIEGEDDDDGDRYYYEEHIQNTFHQMKIVFYVKDGKVCEMLLGSGGVTNYQKLED